jgi:ubiquinone/menaquinone biosynthesis C-methylase UbiE
MKDDHYRKVKDLYSAWASTYDNSFVGEGMSAAVVVEIDLVNKYVKPRKTDHILDIGCGTGRITEQLYKATKSVDGVDISREMIEVAKGKLPKVNFLVANIEEGLPFESNTYDKIVSSLVFQFIDDINISFNEIYRVLKAGGEAIITTFVSDGNLDWNDVDYVNERTSTIPSGSVGGVSIFRPLNDFLISAKEAGFSSTEYDQLLMNDNASAILTKDSFKKAKGRWASVVLVLKK